MNPYLKGIQEDLDKLFEMMSHDALVYDKWANDYTNYNHERAVFQGMVRTIKEYQEVLKPLLP